MNIRLLEYKPNRINIRVTSNRFPLTIRRRGYSNYHKNLTKTFLPFPTSLLRPRLLQNSTTMVDGEIGILRCYELRLLRCTVSLPPSDPPLESQSGTHQHDTLIRSLLSSIESGDYLGALDSDAARLILGDVELDLVDSVDSAERFYSELLDKVESFVVNGSPDNIDKARRAILVMCLAIAAALWFTRCNLTG